MLKILTLAILAGGSGRSTYAACAGTQTTVPSLLRLNGALKDDHRPGTYRLARGALRQSCAAHTTKGGGYGGMKRTFTS